MWGECGELEIKVDGVSQVEISVPDRAVWPNLNRWRLWTSWLIGASKWSELDGWRDVDVEVEIRNQLPNPNSIAEPKFKLLLL